MSESGGKEEQLRAENEDLRVRLAENEETLRAIREGEVDTATVSGPKGEQAFSLAGTESIYRLIVETMKEAALTVALDGTILFCNGQCAKLLARQQKQIIGHLLQEFVPADQLEAVDDLLVMGQQKSITTRLVLQNARHEPVPVHVATNVLNQPESISICIVAADFTELENSTELVQQLRLQQDALRQSEERTRLLSEVARELLIVENPLISAHKLCQKVMRMVDAEMFSNHILDESGHKLRLNASAGFPPEAVARMECLEIGTELFGKVAETGQPQIICDMQTSTETDTDIMRSSGCATVAGFPLRLTAGKVAGSLAFCSPRKNAFSAEDLSLMQSVADHVGIALERHQGEKDLREEKERLRLATEVGGIGVWYLDVQQMRLQLSERCKVLYGISTSDDVTMETVITKIHPEDRQKVKKIIERALSGTSDTAGEYRVIWPDGTAHWILARSRTYNDEENRLTFNVGAAIDVTATKEFEYNLLNFNTILEQRVTERAKEVHLLAEHLRALAAELTHAEQRERKRVAQVLHDHIQQLLVAARMRINIIKRAANEAQRSENLTHADRLLTEAISASRTLTVELSPPVLHEAGLGAALFWLGEHMYEQHHFWVTVSVESKIEPESEDAKLFLFDAVRELLFNSCKHAGVDQARVTMRQDGHWILITTEDEGKGFEPDSFFSQRSSSGKFGMFSICERLQLLGGVMQVESAPGAGTHITIRIPQHETGAKTETMAKATSQTKDVSEVLAHKVKVLIVDDHQVVRDGLAGLLQREGELLVIGEAKSGEEALEKVQHEIPDVVLMDVTMPGMGGIEATRRIRQQFPQVQIVGLSMHEDPSIAEAMLEAGANDYVTKDSSADKMLDAVHKVAV